MFDNFAVFQTKDVNAGETSVVGTPFDQVVRYDKIAFGDNPPDLHVEPGALHYESLCGFDEGRSGRRLCPDCAGM